MDYQRMRYQPFSDRESIQYQICHPNNMGVNPVPQGTQFTCSGCQLPGSGSAFVCWQCKVFLHEHCFRNSNTSVIQPPDLSTLSIGPCLTNPPRVTINGKEYPGNFPWPSIDLEVRCTANPNSGFYPCPAPSVPKTPSELIESLEHKSHPRHPLKLEFYPAFFENQSSCAACGGKIKDNCAYRCNTCNYDLHVKCAFLPEALPNEEHDTPMTLYYSVTSAVRGASSYVCSICRKTTPKDLWVYYCRDCDYGTDASCILAKERLKEDLQIYKDSFESYTNGPGSSVKCTRKWKWWG